MKRFLIAATLALVVSAFGKAERPNIVWLVSEDNSADWLRLYNMSGAPMPNIEKLAKNGLVFNNAFSCAPVCSVARSTIISGCYAPRLGVQFHRNEKPVPMPENLKMFPWYLREAGYYTSNNAKEDYNFLPSDKAGVWDESSNKASYRKRADGQPFFHVQNYGTTHEGKLHFKNMDTETTTSPASVKLYSYHPDTETFRYTYARYLDNHMKVDQQMGELIRGLEEDGLLDDTFIFYYGDHGGVLPRGKGYIYNNGINVPMVVYVPKNWAHIAPAARGSRIGGFVQFVDLSATVLNLAGVEIPEGIDGRPFLGNGVALSELNARDTAFGYADRFDEKYDMVRTVRKGDFQYIRNYQPFNFDGLHNFYRYKMLAYREWWAMYQAGELNPIQSQFFESRPAECLYDISKDPDAVFNLAGDPKYDAKLREMRALLQNQVKSMPDLSFIPEPRFLEMGSDNPTAFGAEHKEEIVSLVEIADLSLRQFPEIKQQLGKALESSNPWKRYWGLMVCSAFGTQASEFNEKAAELAESDPERLVRVRAAEFLGLTEAADPKPALMQALREVENPTEANFILNTVALLTDAKGVEFDLSEFKNAAWAKDKKVLANRRLDYLIPAGK